MAYVPAVLTAAGIALVSLMENPQMPQSLQAGDKVLHGLMYAVFSVTLLVPYWINRRLSWQTCLTACCVAGAYGMLMECLQTYCTLTRCGDMADNLANIIGAVIGVTLTFVISKCLHGKCL